MKVVIDIECNSLNNPSQVWLIVCKDIETKTYHIFRNLTQDDTERQRFNDFTRTVDHWIGHNFLGYDYPILRNHNLLCNKDIGRHCTDTLIISKLVDYPRPGHSIEDYGLEFSYPKIKFNDWTKYSKDMEEYCIRDVDICHKIYLKYKNYIEDHKHTSSILLEHRFQFIVNDLSTNGFYFNNNKATELLRRVERDLSTLDISILETFVPKLKYIRTIVPKETKYGTISLTSIPKEMRSSIADLTVDAPFCYCRWHSFNPSSHKQIIEVLGAAGWRPVDKTKTHVDTERELNKLKYTKRTPELDIRLKQLYAKLEIMKKAGWKINENNLDTLPQTAPLSARSLAKRILLESRRRTLVEWTNLVDGDQRIRGAFYGIGAWTHRMAHRNPNTANIPLEFDTGGKRKLLGKELRSLWCAPKNRLLIGVDAEGIQLRIFAHYINDPEFTKALVEGKKENKSDPHSLNQRILGSVCRSRAAAKRYIYALLLGAGNGKLTEILGCSTADADAALQRLMDRYQGFELIKSNLIPSDAKRGWFRGLDGRKVRILGDTISERKHRCMSGYLQNGEAIVMKSATLLWHDKLKDYDAKLVNLVHDEWQVECPNNMNTALHIAEMMASSLNTVGKDLKLNCPLAGNYWNDDLKDYTIATNWSRTH